METRSKEELDKSAQVISKALENNPSNKGLIVAVSIFVGLIILMITMEVLRR